MTTTRQPGLWALRRPPADAVDAARRAFGERRAPGTRRLDLVFDSVADPGTASVGGIRILMFSGDGLAVLATSLRVPEGTRIGGAVFGRTAPVALAIRRPTSTAIALSATADGRLLTTTVPAGPACVCARGTESGEIWQSEWLTL
jgi:hypothetical protein